MIGILTALLCCVSVIAAIALSSTAELSKAAVGACSDAVSLAVYLAGTMALWGGLMRIAEKAGLTKLFGRLLSPVTKRLFKDCDEQTMKNISMNITANLLGIGNAATPLGIAAVKGMSRQGGRYMKRNIAMLTVLNTASIQLFPTTIGAMRAKFGAQSPFDVTLPILLVSLISAFGGCLMVFALSIKRKRNAAQ